VARAMSFQPKPDSATALRERALRGQRVPAVAGRRSAAAGQPPTGNSGAAGGGTQTEAPDSRPGQGGRP
jgi:hypothetical protein